MRNPQLVLPLDYMEQAAKAVRRAKKRVFLIGLTLFRSDSTGQLLDAMITAAQRGIEVHVAADFATYINAMRGIRDLPLTYRNRSARAVTSLGKDLTAAGAQFRWLGRQYGYLFMGRTHSKWLVVDNMVFSFGGVNIDRDSNFRNHTDYMFRIESQELADLLVNEQVAIEKVDKKGRTARNHSSKISIGKVLFDGGKPGRSMIYDTALRLARQASEILLVSQHCPTGRLGKVLAQKPSRIYFNQLKNVDSKQNQLMIRLGKPSMRRNNLYNRAKYLHSKFMVFTMPDGSRRAITGSHNFVAASSRLGTREVALETDDEKIISQLEKFFHEHIE
ncbi:phosphatidylserine/phosphatidylglycerophosphate/cardiolipin synthase family protein [Candidatus Saccharibacteria bacterium]|nr:phosphatidylserine/phosphatidylglycerophosphate/cardiolipin synthase family protein [Candidatus Saccharibacteria bacterium]